MAIESRDLRKDIRTLISQLRSVKCPATERRQSVARSPSPHISCRKDHPQGVRMACRSPGRRSRVVCGCRAARWKSPPVRDLVRALRALPALTLFPTYSPIGEYNLVRLKLATPRPPGTDLKVGTESKGHIEVIPSSWFHELRVIHTN